MAFDGVGEDISEFSSLFTSYSTNSQQPQSYQTDNVNGMSSPVKNRNRSSTSSSQHRTADVNHNLSRLPFRPHPKPLHIRKPSGQLRVARSQQQLNDNNTYNGVPSSPIYPPRRSSIRNYTELNVSPSARRQKSDTPSAVRSTVSTHRTDLFPETFGASPSLNTVRSTPLSQEAAQYFSDSSGIIGNFVPIGPSDMGIPPLTSNGSKGTMHSFSKSSKIPRPNPYQFEPDTPFIDEQRHTTFSDFIENRHSAPTPSPRVGHMKNSLSEGNGMCVNGENVTLMPPKPSYTCHRSESSPHLNATQFEAPRRRVPSPDIHEYYSEDVGHAGLPHRGRSPSLSRPSCDYGESKPSPSYYQTSHSYSMPSRSGSPVCREHRSQDSTQHSSVHGCHSGNSQESTQYLSAHGHHSGKTPTKTLHDVAERDERDERDERHQGDFFFRPESSSKSPKKRSRSPMKKMFGENGWLGRSPDEISDVKAQVKKASIQQKDKPTMMGKLRNKLGEFADISPSRSGRPSNDKHPKISILSVSLGPPEQARLLMEVELMIVHTANTFLMNQFSQGRIAVDSIKKTVDAWKNKGRHVVIEFMYDQVTQRDLVATNQHNFRFYGERAGNDIRINSMLYNWKQVASMMAIRTFCDADTVILKLLFDVEQILELLGGAEAIMLRLQQIRATANEMMRLARQRKEARTSAQVTGQPATPGRAATWLSQSSNGTASRGPSIDVDPYGGMKLVPDAYKQSSQ